jgi:hypothetical protein
MAIVVGAVPASSVTMLGIIQDVCTELGINVPNAVVTSNDPQTLQMLALLNKEGRALSARPSQGWQALQVQTSFTTVANEIQTTLDAVAPGCRFIINDTIWNRSNRRPIFGPLSPQQWQMQKGWFSTGPYSQYRIQNGNIEFVPVPSAGDECYFEYVTKNWVYDGVTMNDAYQNDSDLTYLDDDLLRLGLIYRWKQIKGLDYSENKVEYEDRVNQAIARDTPKSILGMSRMSYSLPPLYIQNGDFPSN